MNGRGPAPDVIQTQKKDDSRGAAENAEAAPRIPLRVFFYRIARIGFAGKGNARDAKLRFSAPPRESSGFDGAAALIVLTPM
jgi:hypothetical protein